MVKIGLYLCECGPNIAEVIDLDKIAEQIKKDNPRIDEIPFDSAEKYMAVTVIIYLLMGWSFLLVSGDVLSGLGSEFIFLLLGGICYTVGVLFFISKFFTL